MKKLILLFAFPFVLCGCGEKAAPQESLYESQEIQTIINTTSETTEKTILTTTERKPDYDYDIQIKQKMMFEDKNGNYDLFVLYYFENVSGDSLKMWDLCDDIVFLDGVQCDESYKEYDLNASNTIPDAKKSDLILDDNLVGVTIGYKLKNYNPNVKHDIVIQVTKPFHPEKVFREEKITSDHIQLRKWEE